jgi:hypothetical protein
MNELEYPEHEKLKLVKERSQCVGEFLEWLDEQHILLSRYVVPEGCTSERLMTANENTENLLARFFEIDLKKLEKEKLEMLKKIRDARATG